MYCDIIGCFNNVINKYTNTNTNIYIYIMYSLLLLSLAHPPGDFEQSHRGSRPKTHGALGHRRAPGEGEKSHGKMAETVGTSGKPME